MGAAVEIVPVDAGTLSESERARCHALIIEGGEVASAALATNIASARKVVLLREGVAIRGLAVLKRPQGTYRAKIVALAGVALSEQEYLYELGYVFIEPGLQGNGWSHGLIAEALTHADGAGLFATARTDNLKIRSALEKAGFSPEGSEYMGQQGRPIGILVRPGSA